MLVKVERQVVDDGQRQAVLRLVMEGGVVRTVG